MIRAGDIFRHDHDALGRDMIVALPPDERGWFAYAVIGEGPARFSGHVTDAIVRRRATPWECEKHGVAVDEPDDDTPPPATREG